MELGDILEKKSKTNNWLKI